MNKNNVIFASAKSRKYECGTCEFGFTLIELLVVMAIIGLLSTLSVSAVNYARGRAREVKAIHDIDEISKAMTFLAHDTGEWPGHQAVDTVSSGANNEICGLDINSNNCVTQLSSNSSGLIATDGSFSGWGGPYLGQMPTDAWGREYFLDTDYQVDIDNNPCGCGGGGCTDAVVVGSYGPDEQGVPGSFPGAYGCDDIIKIIAR